MQQECDRKHVRASVEWFKMAPPQAQPPRTRQLDHVAAKIAKHQSRFPSESFNKQATQKARQKLKESVVTAQVV